MPIDYEAARAIAQRYIEQHCPPELECLILDDEVVETEVGWIFFYQAARYFETRNPLDRLLGNLPIHIDRGDGSLSLIDQYTSIEDFIRQHAARRADESGDR